MANPHSTRRRKGVSLMVTAVSLAFIIPTVGMIIDVGILYSVKARLQAAVDGASLAAARAPNVFIQPNEGVIYSGSSKKIAEHGGGAPGDTEVALLVAGHGIAKATVHHHVSTTQVAPTILEALGLDPKKLDAVKKEGTRSLPGLDFGR